MNNEFQKRLYDYEQQPSPDVWSKLAESMGNNFAFSQKLYQYQQQPAAGIWNRIEQRLSQSASKIVPFKRKKIVQYLSAAAILLLLVSASIFLLNKTDNSSPAANTIPLEEPKKTPDVANSQKEIIQPQKEKQDEGQKTSEPLQKTASTEPTNHRQVTIPATAGSRSKRQKNAPPAPVAIASSFITDIHDRIRRLDFSLAERYMVYSDGSGKVSKLPKKLFSAVHCADGDLSCKSNLEVLQQKVSSASLSTDFIGFMEMLRHVQENQ